MRVLVADIIFNMKNFESDTKQQKHSKIIETYNLVLRLNNREVTYEPVFAGQKEFRKKN